MHSGLPELQAMPWCENMIELSQSKPRMRYLLRVRKPPDCCSDTAVNWGMCRLQ